MNYSIHLFEKNTIGGMREDDRSNFGYRRRSYREINYRQMKSPTIIYDFDDMNS